MDSLGFLLPVGVGLAGAAVWLLAPDEAERERASATGVAHTTAALSAPAPAAGGAAADTPTPSPAAGDASARKALGATSAALAAVLGAKDDGPVQRIDLDMWRGRRQAARFTCDACVVVALLLATAFVLVHDYGFDVPAVARRLLPREVALMHDIAAGMSTLPAAVARQWARVRSMAGIGGKEEL